MSKNKPTAAQMPVEAPAGEWVDVKHGMIPAIGVIPHPDQETYPGVIVREDNPEIVVVWHNKGCSRQSPKPDKVEFDAAGAPWCPTCFKENELKTPDWNKSTEEIEAERVERLARMREHASRGEFRDPAVKLDTVADAVARFQAEEAAKAKEIESQSKINPPTVFE